MNGLGDEFLAGSAFSEDQYRSIGSGYFHDHVKNLGHHRRCADNSLKSIFGLELSSNGLQLGVFFHQLGDIGHGFNRTDHLAVRVLQNRGIFQNMHLTAVFTRQRAFSSLQFAGFEQQAPMGAVVFDRHFTDIAVEGRTLLADQLLSGVSGDAFHCLIDRNDGAVDIHHHYAVLYRIDNCFPVLIQLMIYHG